MISLKPTLFAVACGILVAINPTILRAGMNSDDPSGADDRSVVAALDEDELIESGFLIAGYQCLMPPYRCYVDEGQVLVNGTDLQVPQNCPELEFAIERYEEYLGQPVDSEQLRDPIRVHRDAIASYLRLGCTVVALPGFPPIPFDRTREGIDLLTFLCSEGIHRSAQRIVPYQLLSSLPDDLVHDWLLRFEPSPDFQRRADSEIALIQFGERLGLSKVSNTLMLSSIEYPLTMLAMILVVLSCGHLMSNHPSVEQVIAQLRGTALSHRSVCISLAFAFALSCVDLTATLIATNEGTMREVNPIGASLIDSPMMLLGFKLSVTCAAIAILFALRRTNFARHASWWSCLILTLVAARWLTFSSLLMS